MTEEPLIKPVKRAGVAAALAEGNIAGILAGLSALQLAFAREYIKDLNGTQAAIRSGYPAKNAGIQAHQNLKHPGITAAIDFYKSERAAASDISSDYVINKIARIVEDCGDKEKMTALRGLELLARHLGMFIERTEISGKDGDAIKYETTRQDADAFTSAITSLTKRARAAGLSIVTDTGTDG